MTGFPITPAPEHHATYSGRVNISNRIKAVVDHPLALRKAPSRPPPARGYVIGRGRNDEVVRKLVETDFPWHRWNLDESPGKKFNLLNRLLAMSPPQDGEWLVFADDDVVITRGGLARFLALANEAEFDIAQPGHDRRGYPNYGLTVSRPLSRARLTTFVEIGPIFAVAPSRRIDIIPFRDEGMGFGLERRWFNLQPSVRFGVVDEVRMRHLVPAGTHYDSRLLNEQVTRGWDHLRFPLNQPQETLGHWPSWARRRPSFFNIER